MLLIHKMNMNLVLGTSAVTVFLYVFLFVFLLLAINFHRKPKLNLPPSPSKLPVIGNLHQLSGSSSPHRALRSLAQKHGPLMLIHLGRVPTLVISSADMARAVFKTYDHVFSSRPEMAIPKRLVYGKDLAFGAYGEYWRQVRKVCVVQLLSATKIRSSHSIREEEIACMMEKLMEASLTDSAVNLSQMFTSLTNNTICRVAFGRKYDQGERGRKFRKMLKDFTTLLGVLNLEDMVPSLAWVNYLNGINKRVEKNFREIDLFLDEVIQEHVEKKSRRNEKEEEDFVDVLLGIEKDGSFGIPFGRDNTKGIIMDMFAGGTDTASVTLDWVMSELIREPKIMEEVQKEVREVSRGKLILKENDTKEMHNLKAAIKETLRLHPSLPLFSRASVDDVQFQGYDIPAKTSIMINAFAIGRDPDWWEEPDKFWPKRFLNSTSASIDFKGQDFQLIPFGAGRRICPGLLFTTSIIEVALANLLNRFNWVFPRELNANDFDMDEGSGITVYKKNELIMVAKPYY